MLEDTRLAGIRAKPVLCGSFVWNRGRIVRGNWLDGLRVSKNGTNGQRAGRGQDRKSTRLNSSHVAISYAVFCLKKKKNSLEAPQPDGGRPQRMVSWRQ